MAIEGTMVENRYSWLVCISAFISNSLVFGFHSSYGSIFVAITNEMGISETVAAWIGSISFGLVFLSASLSSLLCHKYGCRPVMLFGTFLYSVGLISSTFVVNPGLLFLTYSIILGFGSSCIHFSCLLVLRSHFSTRLSLASGIVASGSGVGGLAINPVMGKLLETYGLQKSILIYASSSIVMYITGIIFREGRTTKLLSAVRKKTPPLPKEHKVAKVTEPSLFCNGALILLTICHSLICFGFYIPQVHLIRLALLKGVPYSRATMLPGYIAGAQAFGKVIFGKLSDWSRINRLMACQLCLLMTTVANCLAPLSLSYSPLTAYAVCWGFFDGAYNILVIFLTGDLAGRHRIHAAYGFASTISSVFMLLGPPVAGFIHASTGSYETVFFLAGGNITLAICLMFLIPWFIPKYVTDQTKFKLSSSDVSDIALMQDQDSQSMSDFEYERPTLLLTEYDSNEQYPYYSTSLYSIQFEDSHRLLPPYSASGKQTDAPFKLTKSKSKSSPAVMAASSSQEMSELDLSGEDDLTRCRCPMEKQNQGEKISSISSTWSVSSLLYLQSEREMYSGSRTTNSDSGIYLSTKKNSLITVNRDAVQTELYDVSSTSEKSEDYHSRRISFKKPSYIGTIFGFITNKKPLSEKEFPSNSRNEIIFERVTCV